MHPRSGTLPSRWQISPGWAFTQAYHAASCWTAEGFSLHLQRNRGRINKWHGGMAYTQETEGGDGWLKLKNPRVAAGLGEWVFLATSWLIVGEGGGLGGDDGCGGRDSCTQYIAQPL
jgi:hypothetical protein